MSGVDPDPEPPVSDPEAEPVSPLAELQDRLLERILAGEDLDRAAVLREHPAHAAALARFFEVVDAIEVDPRAELPAPSRLGEFEIVREIGRGGMGIVYEAQQPSLKRRVALKVLPPALARDPRRRARFQREAEAAARLRHPGIVPVFSVGEAGGAPFFAMELVDGRPLSEILRARREGAESGEADPTGALRTPGSWRSWALATAARLAEALSYAHAHGILHRDVKPANILVEAQGTPRLTDFGIALDLDASELTQTGEVCGSPCYMSPEQAFRREQPLDERSDVYSLGVTLYEMLLGRLPYAGTTSAEYFGSLHSGALVAPRRVDPELPAAIEAVLLRALERDPHRRYASAAEFAADLEALGAGRAPATPRRSSGARRWLWLAAAACVLFGGAGVWILRSLPAPDGLLAGLRDGLRDSVAAQLIGWTPAREELARLADGAVAPAEAEAQLARWLQAGVRLRGVLARSAVARDECWIQYGAPAGVDESLCLAWLWELSVDGGAWEAAHNGNAGLTGGNRGLSVVRPAVERDLWDVLGERRERDSLRLRHRLRILLTRGRVGELPDAAAFETTTRGWPGARWTWTSPERTVFVYDDYPADYPSVRSDEELDAELCSVLTPARVFFDKLVTSGGARSLRLGLEYGTQRASLAACCEAELCDPADGRVLARTRWARNDPRPGGANSVESTQTFYLDFELAEADARLPLELEAGRVASLRLVLRPSRAVALGEPDIDEYWGGTLDVVVPLARRRP